MTDTLDNYRVEKDSMGEIKVPKNALYGAQTQRAIDNFKFSNRRIPDNIISALLDIKQAAALANFDLKKISKAEKDAIIQAVNKIEQMSFGQLFPIDLFQTGSGTSSNMNVNEVIANVACTDSSISIHPNDIVNNGQSSNDVFPSSIQIAIVRQTERHLLPAANQLSQRLTRLAKDTAGHVKNGRTHLMDATPINFSQEILTWKRQVDDFITRLEFICAELKVLPLGGTAVGNGINTDKEFAKKTCDYLATKDALSWRPESTPSVKMASQDAHLAFASMLKNAAIVLIKIANDLRWMNSGPTSGLSEIKLKALQPGSSIMPGKVNPVIAEAVAMIAAEVIGNESSITVAAQSGNFQLNVMLPLIGEKLDQSILLLTNACLALDEKVLQSIEFNFETCRAQVLKNPILVTALNQKIGYEKAASIAHKAVLEGRSIIEVAIEETELNQKEIERLLDIDRIAKGNL